VCLPGQLLQFPNDLRLGKAHSRESDVGHGLPVEQTAPAELIERDAVQ
jgi:hypothetical protein